MGKINAALRELTPDRQDRALHAHYINIKVLLQEQEEEENLHSRKSFRNPLI